MFYGPGCSSSSSSSGSKRFVGGGDDDDECGALNWRGPSLLS